MTWEKRSIAFALGIVLLIFNEIALTQSVTRGPYLQLGTPTSVVVRWRTNSATDSRVRYGSAPGSLTLAVDDATSTTEHVLQLTGLSPDTKYYYSIGTTSAVLAGDDASYFFVTSPSPGTSKPTRIWVLGDSGTKNDNQRAVRDAYYNFTGSRHTDFWMMLGDNAYSDGSDSDYQLAVFQNMYEAMLRKSVLWPTRGNHDSATPTSGTGAYYDIFTLPKNGEAGGLASGTEVYYSFDYGNIHFICLESTSSTYRAVDGAMFTWLQADLAANDKNWTIAFWHHPPYSKGSHDSDISSQLIEMRERALPILEDGGVDLVLCGHSHSYERSCLLDGHYGFSSALTPAMKINPGNGRENGDGAYTKTGTTPTPHAGSVYIVAGSSGHTGGGSLNHPVMITSLDVLGSVVLDINSNRLDATFINEVGTILDYFTMLKGPGGGPATQLAMISGDNQTALAGSTLPNPFVVEARDANDNPVPDVQVTFEVNSGGGSLSNSQPQVTGSNGRASTVLTLGATTGTNTVTATATGLTGSPLLFTATGNSIPLITTFSPSKAQVGAVVTITGNNFSTATQVAFNGVSASNFAIDSNTQISVVVPSGATTGKISVSNPDGTGFSAANFTVQYSLTVNTVGSGTVTFNLSGGVYDAGTTVTLTAYPGSGYQFSGWSGDLTGSTNPATITMDANKNVTATFTPSDPGGGGTIVHEETKTGGSTGLTSVTTSSSLVGVSGHLYLATISNRSNRSVTSVSGLGLSWTRVKAQCSTRGRIGLEVWMAQGTPSVNGVVTATFSSAPNNAAIAVSRYAGVSATNPIGNLISGNLNGVNGTCSGGSESSAYSFNLTTTTNGAMVYGAIGMRERTHTPGAGYTERAELMQGSGSNAASVAVEDKNVASAGTTVVNGSFSGNVYWAVVALELKPQSGGSTTQYTLTVNTSGSGSVGLNPSGGTYDSGAMVELTATPAAGYQFSGWSGDLTGSTNPATITMDGNKTVTATFTEISATQYTLTVNTVGSGTVSLNPLPNNGTYIAGATVELTANPAAGYQFSGWSGDLTGSTSPTTITMNANKNVTATFVVISPDIVYQETKTGGSTSSNAVSTSASLTAANGDLYLAAISTKSKVSVTAVSGLGLTWTLVKAQCAGRNQTGMEIWKAQGTPSGNGTVTATLASTPSNAVIAVSRYSGVNATNPIGNVVSANTMGVNGVCSGGTDNSSYSFNLITTVNGAVVYGAAALRNKTHTPGAGYTERAEFVQDPSNGGSAAGLAVEDKTVASASTATVNGTFGSAVDWAVVAVEIKPQSGVSKRNAPSEETIAVNSSPPAEYRLEQNHPNPFWSGAISSALSGGNPTTSIRYNLPQSSQVRLTIYDINGRVVTVLVDGFENAGIHTRMWEAVDSDGHPLPSGIYYCQLRAASHVSTIKMLLIR